MQDDAKEPTAAPDGRIRDYKPDAQGPLEGVRVLDLSRLVAGNILTHVLADYGAEVVKVEYPGRGDDLRSWQTEGVSTFWKVYSRSKKSVSLKVNTPQGRDLLLGLVRTAHVLVENFRPGTMEAWGLGPDVLLAENPRLVVVRISGWGQTGLYAKRPGFGTMIEAMSGFAMMNGYPDRPPVLPPLALADMVAGYSGASAVLVALRAVEVAGGAGQVVDLSLFDPLFAITGPEPALHKLTGRATPRMGNRVLHTAPRNIYACADGAYVALSASMQSTVERLFRMMDRADLIDDPRFRTNNDRVANADALDAIVGAFMAERTQADNLVLFETEGITAGPVYDVSDLVNHPYVLSRDIIVEVPDDEMGSLPMHNVPARLSRTPGAIRSPAPKVGEHNAELLGELGLTAADLAALRADGVV